MKLVSLSFDIKIPTFISLPSSTIPNYDQETLLFMIRCSTPLYIYSNLSLVLLSNFNSQQFDQYLKVNKPISVIYGNGQQSITPDLVSFTQFDISFSVATPLEVPQFIVQIDDHYFFNSYGVSVPYSSPLIVTRDDSTNYQPNIIYNPLSINKYQQKNIKGWDEKLIDIDYKDSAIRYIDGLPFLDISLSIPGSGSGEIKLQPVINSDGYEYQIDEFSVSISKKDTIYQLPFKYIDTISLYQEETFKTKAISSSREEFFYDAVQVKVRKYVCNGDPTLFFNISYADVLALEEVNLYASYQFRPIENLDVVAVEYIWDQSIGWSVIQFLSQDKSSYGCTFLDRRNQFCPFCDRVTHKFEKTNISYYIFQTNGNGSLFDFGLDVSTSLFGNSFYFKNPNDYVENSQSHLSFSYDSFLILNNSYILVPSNNISETSYYLWLSDITTGCNGINVTNSNFLYLSSCKLDQYSCSNIHYFRETQSRTAFINENFNYLFSNKRSGIKYVDNNSLSIELPQSQMDIILSLYISSLPLQQPFIKELSFKSNETLSLISISYSFFNYGKKEGEFIIQIDCSGSNSFLRSGIIKPNGTQDIEFSFQKSIIKTIKNYECVAKVNLNYQKLWSTTGKEIKSSINFTIIPNEIIQECDQELKSLIKVTKQSFKEQDSRIGLLFTIQNQIDSIDMFRLNISCTGNAAQSKIVQISTGSSVNVPISIQESSHSKCKSTIESYQIGCKYYLYNNEWDYINNSNSLKSSLLSVLLVLILIIV